MISTFTFIFALLFLSSHATGQNDNSTKCTCVPFYLCNNGTINTNGENITDGKSKPVVDIRFNAADECSNYLDTCCSKENVNLRSRFGSVSNQKGCGFRNSDGIGYRISGDSDNESQFGEFPWMVAIFFKSNQNQKYTYKCGGSLIHPKVVLTATHCIESRGTYKIRVGEWDSKTTREILKHQDMDIKEIVRHPNYSWSGLYNDISLLFLELEVSLTSHVNVACLPHQENIVSRDWCFVTGWGQTRFENKELYQSILKKVELLVMDRERCQNAFRNTRLGQSFTLHQSFMCAGGEEGRDACSGDGGGPLVCPIEGEEERYQQVGIVSWGINCGEKGVPGAYVDVARYRSWIDNQLARRNLNNTLYQP